MKTRNSGRHGFTLVEIMIVVAIIGLLAAIAIPNFIKARETSQKNGCIKTLRTIMGAKGMWCLEFKKTPSDTPVDADIFGVTAFIREKPTCPANGTYTLMPVDTNPTCNIPGHTL